MGKTVKLVLTVEVPAGGRIELPKKIGLPPDVELLSVSEETGPEKNGSGESRVTFEVAAYKLGEITVPSFEFGIIDQTGKKTGRETGEIKFTIRSVRTDPATAKDILFHDETVDNPLRPVRYFIPFLLLLIALIAGALLWRWWSKRRAMVRPGAAAPPPVSPDELAYRRLDSLLGKKLTGEGKVREHYYELSEIVREYIEGRYNAPALERTTQEIKVELTKRPESEKSRRAMTKLLTFCDLAKFSKEVDEYRDQGQEAVQTAKSIVDETRERKEEAVEV